MRATRITLLACLLTALVYAAGEALAGIPNVEVITLLVFVAGFLLGPGWGTAVGGAGMGAHSLFNALGTVAPPLWVAQVVCYALVGFCGGWMGPRIAALRTRTLQSLASATAGFLLVLLYQLVVNTVSFRSFAAQVPLATYVWGGIAFAAVQMVWNAALFFVALPPVLKVLGKARVALAGKAAV
jgi:hypothetical protein